MDAPPIDIVDRFPAAREPMTTLDRCDAKRCGAQAHASSYHHNGKLLWCMHHFMEYQDNLVLQAIATSIHPSYAEIVGEAAYRERAGLPADA